MKTSNKDLQSLPDSFVVGMHTLATRGASYNFGYKFYIAFLNF